MNDISTLFWHISIVRIIISWDSWTFRLKCRRFRTRFRLPGPWLTARRRDRLMIRRVSCTCRKMDLSVGLSRRRENDRSESHFSRGQIWSRFTSSYETTRQTGFPRFDSGLVSPRRFPREGGEGGSRFPPSIVRRAL